MKIRNRLILTLIVMSILPVAMVGFVGLQVINASTSLTLDRSLQALKDLGEASIRQQALDVARQVELFLQAHPELSDLAPEKMRTVPTLIAIAVQPVGKTGYTAVFDGDGITHFHVNPAMVGMDMSTLANTLPDFWSIFEASLDGSVSAGYYKWQDADGTVRDKYMVCVPVGNTRLRVAATTYIDEFYQPIRETQTQVTNIVNDTHSQLYLALLVVAGLAIGAAVFLARLTIRPLKRIADAAQRFGLGQLNDEIQISSRDEIGQLAVTFNQMARELSKTMGEKDSVAHQLQDLNQHLEQMVETRTSELRKARDEAVAATRLAQENTRLKSEFLSTMSHELRTPLNAIEGFTGIVLNKMGGTDYNNKTEGYLTRIRSNSKRLLQLINDFLDLSRIESGRLELANQPFSPAQLARRWQDEISVLADKKGLQFEVNLDSTLPETIYGDEEAISKVAINLLGNAIKFTEQGRVKLAVERHDGQWEIIVEDTGIGIPPHARDFIFEEFRQVDQSSRRKYGGTGLGLAIVQKYARAMGGSVNVKSELGKGSTFTVILPCKVSA